MIKPAENILTEVNSASAPLAKQMARQDFSREDLANMRLLNDSVWRSVKGAGSRMPSARHDVISPWAYYGEG